MKSKAEYCGSNKVHYNNKYYTFTGTKTFAHSRKSTLP